MFIVHRVIWVVEELLAMMEVRGGGFEDRHRDSNIYKRRPEDNRNRDFRVPPPHPIPVGPPPKPSPAIYEAPPMPPNPPPATQ